METIKEWQKLWFYITEPRDATWAAASEFKSGAPMRLTSWLEKGLNWSSSDELIVLQMHMQSMVDKNIKLVNVIQVMLFFRILPCQSRTCNLWEFNPAKHQTLQQFFGATHEGMWRLYFGEREQWPDTTEDVGLDCNHPDTLVSIQSPNTFHSSIS